MVVLVATFCTWPFHSHAGGTDHYPEYRGDAANTGQVNLGPVAQFEVGWRTESLASPLATGPGVSSPVVVNDTVVVATDRGDLHAFHLGNGSTRWQVAVGTNTTNVSLPPVVSTPCLHAGRVYVGTRAGTLKCVDLGTGTSLWNFSTGAAVTSSPHLLSTTEGSIRIVFTATNNQTYCVTEAGQLAWAAHSNHGRTRGSVAVGAATGVVVVGCESGHARGLNASTGTALWEFHAGGEIYASPVIDDAETRVFVGTTESVLYCLDARTGIPVWNYTTPAALNRSVALDQYNDRLIVTSGTVATCLNRTTGAHLWDFTLPNPSASAPLVDPEHRRVILGDVEGFVYVVAEALGTQYGLYATSAAVTGTPAAVPGTLVIVTDQGEVHCLERLRAQPTYWAEAFVILAVLITGVAVLYVIKKRVIDPRRAKCERAERDQGTGA